MAEPVALPALLGRWSAQRGPLYVLLAARIRSLIDEGQLPAGVLLPPERALARALTVGRGTVVAAYDLLLEEGRIVRRRGSGTRVARQPEGQAATATGTPMFLHLFDSDENVIAMHCAAPEKPPPELPLAARIAASHLAEIESDIGYHPAGLLALREAVARRFEARGLPTTKDQILITNGGQQAISLLADELVRPGDRVLVEAPTYSGALEAFREAGAVLRPTTVGLRDLAAAVAEHQPRVVYAIPTYQNPTGSTMSENDRSRAARILTETGTLLIEDEVLADLGFTSAPMPPAIATWSEASIIVGSISKSIWGGLRIGWIRGPRPLIARLAKARAVHDLGGGALAQLTASELDADAVAARTRAERTSRHDALVEELRSRLPTWTFAPAHGGQTLWIRLPSGDGDSFAQAALRHGVAVLPGSGLDITEAGTHHIRLHFIHDAEVLRDVVRRLAAAWQSYAPPRRTERTPPPLAV